ncbi:NAD(P)/FAD-dependent oxidoreductase [Rhizobium sp. YIM 134829]|uniref:NAD(P)/FAD-dependent oxidoreductase n=1 Tax=Rhizobium sp. YIM 134829 TaxID=3390453 RepID=UPI003979E92C
MTTDRSHSNLWHASAKPAPETTPLTDTASADVAVIGGGFTGVSTALHLAERGATVAVLEAEMIGFGASGRNVGLVNAGMWTMPDDLIATLGQEAGERLLTALGNGPSLVFDLIERFDFECEAVRNGTLHLAIGSAGVAEISARQAQWKRHGAPVETLDETAAKALTGAEGFTGALLDRRAGTIQPLSYVRGLARAALDRGARIYTHSPVVRAAEEGDGWRLMTPQGEVRAKTVVVATDAYGRMIDGMPFTAHTQELTILPYFQFATRPLSANLAGSILPERQGCWDTGTVMTSFRMDKQNRLIFGSIGRLDAIAAGTHRAYAQRALRTHFPQIGATEFEHGWDGRIGMTVDALPRLHRLAANVYSVGGYNGRGIAPGTVFGRALAAHIAGEPQALPLAETPIVPDRLRQLKSAFFHAGAQAKHFIDRRI